MADTETQQVDTATTEDVAKETDTVAKEESAGNEEVKVNGEADDSAPEVKAEEESKPEEDKNEDSKEEEPAKEEQEEQKEEDNKEVNGSAAALTKEENGTETEKKEEKKEAEPSGPFNGTFLHTKSDENLEAFFIEIGFGWIMRKFAMKTNPTIVIVQRENDFHIKMHIGPMTREGKFTVGQQYEDKDMSGEMAKICARIEDGKLIQYFEPLEGSKGKALQVTREIEGDQLIMTLEAGNVTSKRFFTRKT